MTDDEIEKVAREWCRLAGVDPDERVSHDPDPDPSGFVFGIALYSPRWKRVALMVEEHAQMHEAFKVLDPPVLGEP